MKLSELPVGQKLYTQLGHRVLAVLSRGADGWRVYVDAVPGESHDNEWQEVARSGDKQKEAVAAAIVTNLFHPSFEIDIPYVR